MDEPFAALDALTRRQMRDERLQLWNDTRFTVMLVTQSIAAVFAELLTVIVIGLIVEHLVFRTIERRTLHAWGIHH